MDLLMTRSKLSQVSEEEGKQGVMLRDPLIFRDSNNSKCAGI